MPYTWKETPSALGMGTYTHVNMLFQTENKNLIKRNPIHVNSSYNSYSIINVYILLMVP